MAEGKPPDDERLSVNLRVQARQISIDGSVIQNLIIMETPKGSADKDQEIPGKTESDQATSSRAKFLQSKEWSCLSDSIFMYNVEPLHQNREVYRAKQVHASGRERDVVVKLIHTAEEHMRELDCLLKLTNHPNVVKILESGICSGLFPRIYIVMEQCDQNLNEYICENQFEIEKASSFFQQLVAAIRYIHQNEIAHRDLKPSNILIIFEGTGPIIKLSDFGISKELPKGQTKVTVTHPQAGTEGFKAPETYSCGKLGYKADIFPLAINGYFIFTHGGHPYGMNEYRQPVNIMENKEPDLSQLPDFPEAGKKEQLDKLLRQMLQHEPNDRPTAEEVCKDVFFAGQGYGGGNCDVPATVDECCAQDELSKEVVKCSNAIDVSGILRKYDAILNSDEAGKLSDSLAAATQMLRQENTRGAISTLKDAIPRELSALDVKDVAFMLKQQGDFIYAMLMYRVSNEIFKTYNTAPNNAIKWFKELVTCIRCCAAPLIMENSGASQKVAILNGGEFLNELLQDIHDVNGASERDKVLNEASCIVSISRISIDSKRYQYGIDISKEGVKSLTERFGVKAQEYKYFGQLLNNIGEALMFMGDFSDAEDHLQKALDAKKAAKYGSRTVKRRDIKYTTNNLEKCKEKL